MFPEEKDLKLFTAYASKLEGNEKSEAQLFCDRLFQAFGWDGLKEAGATLESKIVIRGKGGKKTTKFADLVWGGKLLIEMKSRGAKLQHHYQQAFEYWQYCTPHPRYVVLCNFDEFWIYDFDLQLYEPVDRIKLKELPGRYSGLNFLFREERKPVFDNDRVAVTREAADKIATVFNLLVNRGISREKAQRFILQCVLALFSQSIGLLRNGFFLQLIEECLQGGSSSDLLGGLFYRMNSQEQDEAGRFKGVQYFNGGLYAIVAPIELRKEELTLLAHAGKENWSKVHPAIFGTLFQSSMNKERRHALGAHFTSEADIQRIVLPSIVRPWRERIMGAKRLDELLAIRSELEAYKVLDPACGSGNFLYIAYRELVRVEMLLVNRLREEFRSTLAGKRKVATAAFVSVKQFYGIDVDHFAVELAKVTLLLGKKLAYDEVRETLNVDQIGMELESPLSLTNLDSNIVRDDALFCPWPAVHSIIGNPPYQSKGKMPKEFGSSYRQKVREQYPEISGRADYCVYWFRRAHTELPVGGRAGLVGTNTIRQNESREAGLDYIVKTGTITEAVSTEVWSGDASVHVSIVNWIKGKQSGKKLLSWQEGDLRDGPWSTIEVSQIGPSLSASIDVTAAKPLKVNANSGACYQGQTHGHEGFLLNPEEASQMVKDVAAADYLHPYLTGDELLGIGKPSRYVIDISAFDTVTEAVRTGQAFKHVKHLVMDDIVDAAKRERAETGKTTGPRQSHAKKWWKLWRSRGELLSRLSGLSRYIACSRLTRRPIFAFVAADIYPSDVVQSFPLEDDYSFGVLQSNIHWNWFVERCSTLKRDFRYTSDTVFDSFSWPQQPSLTQVRKVAKAAVELRSTRQKIMKANGWSLRELYRSLEDAGANLLKDAHASLDTAVRDAYGMKASENALAFLLELNLSLFNAEVEGKEIVGPGLPPTVKSPSEFITADRIEIDPL